MSADGVTVAVPLILLSGIVRSQKDPIEWTEIHELDKTMVGNPWYNCGRRHSELVAQMNAENNGE